ncbi:hypothetical protein HDA32_005525 [Spinactinospora alkalitolerans]|uniref:Uncharacterized protein n=1 Tax=Spinactinospora alkalitolerans TaxID=687207 RepID=A0A852U4G7_9ACTN|nr:hypothetical protein [Spinactinospora alkalitolerans]NYE50405.1 hypothetical protein [Spinactinospora alkalitolerans]
MTPERSVDPGTSVSPGTPAASAGSGIPGRRRAPRRIETWAAVLALLAALTAAPASGATADAPESAGLVRVGADGVDAAGMSRLRAADIAPGYSGRWSVTLANDRAEPVAVGVRVEDLADDDNGCTRPEARVDGTCGSGEGELAEHLRLGVGPEGAGGGRPSGAALGDVAAGSGPRPVTVPAHGRVKVLVDLELPAWTGNEVQSDSVAFTLVWRADAGPAGETGGGFDGPAAEDGVEVRSDAVGGAGTAGLPLTGAALTSLLGLSVALLAGGGLLAVRFHGRRRTSV